MAHDQLKKVKNHFPKAQLLKNLTDDLLSVITNDLDRRPEDTAYTVSFCSDEVNAMQFPENEMIGPFNLGGLGGYPFNGLTGMDAFAAHIPDSGVAAIFYGPHIGITEQGAVGKVNRINQNEASSCCGSVSAALNNLLSNNIRKGDLNRRDYQQKVIEQILLKENERIRQTEQKFIEAVEVVYEVIDNKISELIDKTDFPSKNIIQVGGIFINSDKNGEGFWAPRRFEVRG